MSYIHQALKKAQAQREAGYRSYEGILRSSRLKRPGARKWALIAACLLGMLGLAFAGYSRLDGVGFQSATHGPQASKDAGPTSTDEKTVDVEGLYQMGRAHHTSGRLKEAKVLYEKALTADPGFVSALNNLAVILMAEKDYAAARLRLEKATRLAPECVDACYNLACLFALTDAPEQGLKYLKRALALEPKVKVWAKEDADLERLRKEPSFKELVGE